MIAHRSLNETSNEADVVGGKGVTEVVVCKVSYGIDTNCPGWSWFATEVVQIASNSRHIVRV